MVTLSQTANGQLDLPLTTQLDLPLTTLTPKGWWSHLSLSLIIQAAERLGGVLNSEQYASVMQSFGLPQNGEFGVPAFLAAIAQQHPPANDDSNNADSDPKGS